jgi:transcription elongation factor GreA
MIKYLTAEGLNNLKKELEHLEKVGRKEVAEKLKHALSFGDISENAAYDEAKESLGFLEGKILELKNVISSAKLIQKNQTKEIQMGSTAVIFSEGGKQEFQIVGAEEADVFNGKISYESPLGKMLLGKKKGDKVIVKNPEKSMEYKVLDVK